MNDGERIVTIEYPDGHTESIYPNTPVKGAERLGSSVVLPKEIYDAYVNNSNELDKIIAKREKKEKKPRLSKEIERNERIVRIERVIRNMSDKEFDMLIEIAETIKRYKNYHY